MYTCKPPVRNVNIDDLCFYIMAVVNIETISLLLTHDIVGVLLHGNFEFPVLLYRQMQDLVQCIL